MTKFWPLLLAAAMFQFGVGNADARDQSAPKTEAVAVEDLPKEARATLALIKKGGPYPYQRDGVVFGNFERRLPIKERGYYKEYTVPTPGSRTRGALSPAANGSISTPTTITKPFAVFGNNFLLLPTLISAWNH